ncbi:Ca2+/Na+ antiporter [Candidatus Methylobacter favarea]|uniref:Ca2+/Na+ antiporter n=1 Tax=Candidatus Methylobacter favarea TaxID=2707345 RepID=A0A8S0Y6I6_9GAMM|nr:sodium:calcium antiporter [Candidatus Methylobacter favarea]CAA9891467.1 Ca2+/Na+ antiporter [Candidatus Methylobacter favarea]
MSDFNQYSLAVNFSLFAVAACAVWVAGTKIAAYADELAERFELSHALIGLLLLAGITSLPEIATSFTAAHANHAPLAVNNMLGGIAMQVAVLAVADFCFGERALTSVVPDPVVMLQGAFNICLLTFVAMAIIVGDIPFLGAGLWSWGILAASAYSFIKISKAGQRLPWVINNPDDIRFGSSDKRENARPLESDSSVWLISKIVISALVILFAGYALATVGDVIARQSGLGESFVGFALMSAATSLPEASMVFASVRRGLYTMAISGILGTNPFNVMLIFGVDIIAPGAPVLSKLGDFSAIGTLLGLAVTGLFLMGLVERADRTILRMGTDSAAVLVVYSGGMVLLYSMRGS